MWSISSLQTRNFECGCSATLFFRLCSSSCKSNQMTLSRGVMEEGTVRDSSSNTFSISSCSCLRSTPASAPASTTAYISSEVISSFRTIGSLKMRKIMLAMPLNNHTSGRKTNRQKRIGLMMRRATVSGAIIPMRFGVRSANRMNKLVTEGKRDDEAQLLGELRRQIPAEQAMKRR